MVNVLMKGKFIGRYQELFEEYDSNRDDLLSKDDLQKIMIDSGMKHVTHAEASFIFNILSRFKSTMSMRTFENWA